MQYKFKKQTMKKFLMIFFMALTVVACSSDDDNQITPENNDDNPNNPPQEEVVVTEGSLALRATLEEIKDFANLRAQTDLCFNFDYPINLEYNNGTTESITDYEALLTALLEETQTEHITGIEFPFTVIQESGNTVINSEAEFQTLVADCNYDIVSVQDVVVATQFCFEVNYPVTMYVNEDTPTFNNQSEVEAYFGGDITNIEVLGFDYPFSVTLTETNEELQIEDDYAVVNLINNICGIN